LIFPLYFESNKCNLIILDRQKEAKQKLNTAMENIGFLKKSEKTINPIYLFVRYEIKRHLWCIIFYFNNH